jgi:hypothetical protein
MPALARFFTMALTFATLTRSAHSLTQNNPPARDTTPHPLRVFIDCHTFCDEDFLQTEMSYVSFVRDREASDVHVIVTSENTSAGGNAYTLTLLGRGAFARLTDTLTYTTLATDTNDEQRRAQLRYLTLSLARYAVRTSTASGLSLTYKAPTTTSVTTARPQRDPWNAWVFRVGTNGGMQRETNQRSSRASLNFNANRVTRAWKLTNNARGQYSEQKFIVTDSLSESTITDYSHNASFNHLMVKSLTEHWSLGERVNLNSSTFLNEKVSLRVAPALEFDVFPYSQSTRRQLILQYSVGVKHIRYEDTTLFGKLREAVPDEQLVVAAEAVQPWGNVFASLTAAHHLNNTDRNRLTAFGFIDVRITKGLSLNFFGQASRIRDQINLAKGSLPLQEVLLRRRQLATGYSINFNLGMSYTFGSIFSTVVNPRMNRGSGDDFFFF